MTAWHVFSDAVSSDEEKREIKILSFTKRPLAKFRFSKAIQQDNLRDSAILKDVPLGIIANSPVLSPAAHLPSKGDKIYAYQLHHSNGGFVFQLIEGRLLEIAVPSQEGTLCYTDCIFQHGMSGGPVFNELGLVVGIVHEATEKGKRGSFLALKDCVNSTDIYGEWWC